MIRMGWIVLNDRNGALEDVKQGLINVTGRIFGPNSTVQFALEAILKNTPQRFYDATVEKVAVSKQVLKLTLFNLQNLNLETRKNCFQTSCAVTRINSDNAKRLYVHDGKD